MLTDVDHERSGGILPTRQVTAFPGESILRSTMPGNTSYRPLVDYPRITRSDGMGDRSAWGRRWYCRCGFTLIEMMAAIAIMVILFGAITSVIMLGSKAVDDGRSPTSRIVRTGNALDEMKSDLAYALVITEATTTSIAVSVADRDNDGDTEKIRYSWTGTAGDPLVREYNEGTAQTVATDVKSFAIKYDRIITEGLGDPVPNESGETNLLAIAEVANSAQYSVTRDAWIADCFMPDLPDGTISWRINRVYIKASSDGQTNGASRIAIVPYDGGSSLSTDVLSQKAIPEASLNDFLSWYEVDFSKEVELDEDKGACIGLAGTGANTAMVLECGNENPQMNNSKLFTSEDKGKSWSEYGSSSFPLFVFGTLITEGDPEIVDVYNIPNITISLRSGDDPNTQVEAGVALLNVPEILR